MIRLKSMSITAFRCVRDRIALDLSAPITLICAANGSGKTSICEGAEWLLTGSVKRLQLIGREEDIRCGFADDNVETQVSAVLKVGSEVIELERTLGPGGSEST
jgi:DNA repair protein SbcC/Rad50